MDGGYKRSCGWLVGAAFVGAAFACASQGNASQGSDKDVESAASNTSTATGSSSVLGSEASATSSQTSAPVMQDAPAGLQSLPPFESCNTSMRCNGSCLSEEKPATQYCELMASIYSPSHIAVSDDGILYVSHLGGVGKRALDSASFALVELTEEAVEFIGPLVIQDGYLFFGQVLAEANFFRMPVTGGPSEVLREGALVDEIAVSAAGLVLATNSTLRLATWDGSTYTQHETRYDDTYLGEGVVYTSDGEQISSAPFNDLSAVTALGPAVSGDFVVKSNRVFYSKFRDDFYARSLEGGDEILLWQDMTSGDWDGDVEEITTSPFHNAVFFVFEASSAFLMMWDIETSAVKPVAYMSDVCFKGYSVTREHAYVSGCEGVYRVPLPSF